MPGVDTGRYRLRRQDEKTTRRRRADETEDTFQLPKAQCHLLSSLIEVDLSGERECEDSLEVVLHCLCNARNYPAVLTNRIHQNIVAVVTQNHITRHILRFYFIAPCDGNLDLWKKHLKE